MIIKAFSPSLLENAVYKHCCQTSRYKSKLFELDDQLHHISHLFFNLWYIFYPTTMLASFLLQKYPTFLYLTILPQWLLIYHVKICLLKNLCNFQRVRYINYHIPDSDQLDYTLYFLLSRLMLSSFLKIPGYISNKATVLVQAVVRRRVILSWTFITSYYDNGFAFIIK